jgi:hypothetical protein
VPEVLFILEEFVIVASRQTVQTFPPVFVFVLPLVVAEVLFAPVVDALLYIVG